MLYPYLLYPREERGSRGWKTGAGPITVTGDRDGTAPEIGALFPTPPDPEQTPPPYRRVSQPAAAAAAPMRGRSVSARRRLNIRPYCGRPERPAEHGSVCVVCGNPADQYFSIKRTPFNSEKNFAPHET